jgi:hypothetical protein
VLRRVVSIFMIAAAVSTAHAAACDFEPVKKQIDSILDQDQEKGARFRKQVAEGSDSLAVLERLVSEDMREKIDVCRFYAAEYLAKRGFPPAH